MSKQKKSILVPTFFVTIALALLVPGLCFAGSLEPSDPPGPTMKTLDQIPPTWSQALQADDGPNGDSCNSSRFKCVLGDSAVLDKETGLVWDRYPFSYGQPYDWYGAQWACAGWWQQLPRSTQRKGWRLPTIQELTSLLVMIWDETTYTYHKGVPLGHPFTQLDSMLNYDYWSSTTDFANTNRAWTVSFSTGNVGWSDKTEQQYIWCVRGGLGVDSQ
jgi:hypothetical protein